MDQNEFGTYLTDYQGISKMLKTSDTQEILELTAALMQAAPADLAWFPILKCPMEETGGVYQYVLMDLAGHLAHYDWLYGRLADDRSRDIFTEMVRYRILPALSFLTKAAEASKGADPGEGSVEIGVEGAELDALLEAKERIREGIQILTVCVNHTISGIWEIPRLIDVIRPDYRFTLSYEQEGDRLLLHAVLPAEEPKRPVPSAGPKRVVALSPYERGWSNAELVKDCGVIPYLLYKNHGCEVTMVGAPMADYSNLKYIDGVKLLFLPDGRRETKEAYIRQEAEKIDALILRRPYPDYLGVVEIYKKYNPQGRIYLPLDANSFFVDRIPWDASFMKDFMEKCDVISASGGAMQRHLNEKWPWVIEHVPNGYYHFSEERRVPAYEEKENVILTAGRLGTEQKGTEVLLEAFAGLAEELKDWELRLAGSVEPEFEPYLKEFERRHPGLLDRRIHFLGHIADRETLYGEYARAKIFALTSTWEGGTPNVIAEALYAGDVTAVTRFDEYREATDDGRCGRAAAIGDVDGFRSVLRDLCTGGQLKELSEHAHDYACRHYDMEKIVAELYDRIFGEEQ